jgi:hypothetical protein
MLECVNDCLYDLNHKRQSEVRWHTAVASVNTRITCCILIWFEESEIFHSVYYYTFCFLFSELLTKMAGAQNKPPKEDGGNTTHGWSNINDGSFE